ncbi:MAG: histidine phosphotransferase family protein [Hyphomicrobiales bacterium]
MASPVGAVANGLEVLRDDDDEEMRALALKLMSNSVKRANGVLQFCRMAFGTSGSAGAMIATGEAERTVRDFLDEEKFALSWRIAPELRPKAEIRLLLNMILPARDCIPYGGAIDVSRGESGLTARASGRNACISEAASSILQGRAVAGDLGPRWVTLYYAARLATVAGFTLSMAMEGKDALIHAEKSDRTA